MNEVDTKKFDIALDGNNDIDLNADTGSLNTVKGKRELEQKVCNLLNINKGEISWNRQLGINQYELLMNNGNLSLIQTQVSHYLKNCFNHSFRSCKVVDHKIDKKSRTEWVTLDVVLNSDNGPITISPDLMIGGK